MIIKRFKRVDEVGLSEAVDGAMDHAPEEMSAALPRFDEPQAAEAWCIDGRAECDCHDRRTDVLCENGKTTENILCPKPDCNVPTEN